ncbi:PREDICTED: lysosomal acid phosphatase-like [Papilio xuthus]|uniref:acid phosphatase n=1 Tax=Papilio xuthus TaxID=66420 RepID=A0AAJ6YZ76_PAPXU|nr:PREDICTED: lysosomal acid phosphatase-like [Papilio xuthus]
MYLPLGVLLCLLCQSFGEVSIKYAAIIYRHGDRTPIDPYPTDPWRNESLWPVRFGQLTNIGKRQHYALGQWFRKRYSNIITNKYDSKKVYVRSTNVDRTLMSAEVNLAGMYPPMGKEVWNDHLNWQPIPIHTRPEHDDEVLAMKRKCAQYDIAKNNFINSRAYEDHLSKYEGLMDYLTQHTLRKIKDFEDINDIYNILFIENLYNLTLPKWTHSVFPDKLKEPACYSFSIATATPVMARLLAGPLLKAIVNNMLNKMSEQPDALTLSIYSGHDFTIANILSALGLFDGNCPSYTSTIIFELLNEDSTPDYYVRISYRNTTDIVEPFILNIPNCGKMCPIQRFIQVFDNLISVDWESDCQVQYNNNLIIYFFIMIHIFIFILYLQDNYCDVIKQEKRNELLRNRRIATDETETCLCPDLEQNVDVNNVEKPQLLL